MSHDVKLCECGCGHPAPIAKATNRRIGHVKGQPVRFVRGHARRRDPLTRYVVEDRGHTTPCWIWRAFRCTDGYGQFTLHGVLYSAHRWFYERFVGPIPARYEVDHLCLVRECVNPDHLEAVTKAENLRREWISRKERARAA